MSDRRGLRSEVIRNSFSDETRRMQPRRRNRTIILLVLSIAALYGGIVLLNPWAIHMGNRWTPLLFWIGTGKLVTSDGAYPLLVTLSPSSHGSKLRVYGTIYEAWRSTDGALMWLRLHERIQNFPTVRDDGYFDLLGRWQGSQLVMDDRRHWSAPFQSGLSIKHASVTLRPGSKSGFNFDCAATSGVAQQP